MAVADPGKGPRGPASPLIFRPKWGLNGLKNFFGDRPPHNSGSAWLPPPPLFHLKVWIRHWMVGQMVRKFCVWIAFTIWTNQFHLPENDREGLKIGIKDGFEVLGHEVSLWNIPSGKTGLPFQMFLCSRKFFRWENPKSLVPFTCTFQPDFPEIFVNGKHPLTPDAPQCKQVNKSRLSLIDRVNVVLNRTVVVDSDWPFENLCDSPSSESKWVVSVQLMV